MRNLPRAVAGLLIANVAVFAAGLVPAWGDWLADTGALWLPANDHFAAWQVLSYMFLHGNLSHILFNMFALVSFGTILEREWGAGRFLVFYFLCGLGAGLVQLGVNWYEYGDLHARLVASGIKPAELDAMLATGRGRMPTNPAAVATLRDLYIVYSGRMLGASGAVYGLLVAFGFMHPNARLSLMFIPVPIAAKIVIPILLALDLFSGVTGFSLFGGGIAHFAHIGGAVIGVLLMLVWRHRRPADHPGFDYGT